MQTPLNTFKKAMQDSQAQIGLWVGLADGYAAEILAGVVAVVVIALLIDLVLLLVGRALMPWTRRTRTPVRARAKAVTA